MTEKSASHSRTALSRLFRRIRRNRFWLLLYLWLALLVPALPLQGSGLVRSLLFTATAAMAVFILCTAIPSPGFNFLLCVSCSLLWLLFCGFRLLWQRMFGAQLSVQSLWQLGELFRYGTALRAALLDSLPVIALMGLPSMLLLCLGRMLFSFRPLKRWRQHIPMAAACMLSGLACALCLLLPGSSQASAPSVPPETVPAISEAAPSALETPSAKASGFNTLDLDFAALSSRESREEIAQIHSYFSTRIPSEKNEKTGLLQGCNLIQLTATVSGHWETEAKQMPTLSRMSREGILFSDHRLPYRDAGAPANDLALLAGIIPTGGYASQDAAAACYMPLTMVQQLISRGYSAWGIHCCDGKDCSRGRYLEALGCECAEARQPLRDALDRFIGDCTARSPFTLYCTQDSACGISDLEDALSLLVIRLEQADMLENTLIVLSLEFPESGSSTGLCILWRPGTAPEIVDTPTSPLDLLPTLSNLFGLSYDSRLYMGRDVFSGEEALVVFSDGGWLTELAAYDAGSGKTTPLTDAPLEAGYTDRITSEVRQRLLISSGIVVYDYWRILFSQSRAGTVSA